MERIYCVWMTNRETRNCFLVKAFFDYEKALQELKKQEALLREVGKALKYNIVVDSVEVY